MPNGAGRERRTTWGVPRAFPTNPACGAGRLTPKAVLRDLCVLRGPIAFTSRHETMPRRDEAVRLEPDPRTSDLYFRPSLELECESYQRHRSAR